MLKTLAAASVATLALSAAPAIAQTAPTTFDGLYIGGSVSLDQIDHGRSGIEFDTNRDGSYGDTVKTTLGADAFSPGFCSGQALGNARAAGCSGNASDDIGYAIRIGADKRFGSTVAGVVIEGAKSDAVQYETAYSTTPASYTFSRQLDKSVAARARLGISPGDGQGLLYATGGAVYGQIDRGFTTTNTANSFTLNNGDKWKWGYQVGGGGELLVAGGLSVGLEYLYSRFNDSDTTVTVGQGTAAATSPFLQNGGATIMRPADTHLDMHQFRLTAGLRF